MSKQLHLFPKAMRENISGLESLSYGGGLRKGKRKIARPFSPKKPMHIVLKSKNAVGASSMLHEKNKNLVRHCVFNYAAKNAVKIENFSNVGNHLHLAVRVQSKKNFKRFLRTVTGLIARHMLKVKNPQGEGKFWSELAFSRVVNWGRDFLGLKHYMTKNEFEGDGIPIQTPKGIRLFRIRDGTLRSFALL